MEGSDAEAIKSKTNALAQAAMKLGEAMYKAQASGARPAPAAMGRVIPATPVPVGPAGPEDDVVDADFTEVKDDDDKKSA